MKLLGLDHMTWENIKYIKKDAFMGMIERKLKMIALQELNNEKVKRSKIKNINYYELKTQNYLKDKKIKRK